MKKIITCLFIIFVGILFANPLEPVFISELYFEDGNWVLEIFDYYALYNYPNLDGCYLKSSMDSVYFNDGVTWNENFVFVVDENDMQEPFSIDPTGDEIMFVNEQEYIYDQISFGEDVNPPSVGQSLARISLDDGPPIGGEFFLLATENQPSIGTDPFYVSSYGTFTGYVYDSLMNQIENVQLEYSPGLGYGSPEITTDEDGYFNADLPGMNYEFDVHLLYLASLDTTITIEPDIQNYYEFVFENYVSSDDHEISLPSSFYSLSNYPNPFNPTTEISFSVPQTSPFVNIEIFNSRGQKIKSLQIPNPSSLNTNQITWNGTNKNNKQVPSGVYLYKLVSNGKELAVNKMLLLK